MKTPNKLQVIVWLILLSFDGAIALIVYNAWPTVSLIAKIWDVALIGGFAFFNYWCQTKIIKYL